jgi:DNA-binding NtrC family response regulator
MGSSSQPDLEDKLGAILASCRKMNSERELDPLLDLIAGEAAKLLDCHRASISLLNGQRTDVAGLGIVGRTSNVLTTPLLNQAGGIVGALEALNKRTGAFTTSDEESLRALASHAAVAIETAQLLADLRRENAHLWREVDNRNQGHRILGAGPKLQEVARLIERIRDSVVNVLITGESGTGKKLIAKALHFTSPRARKPLIALNCGLPETLLESFQQAEGGTLLLDEIGDLSPASQATLLRALQERVGVRLVAATNKDLEAEIARGNFREDLYYRIKVIQIHLPSLRDIREEIPLLANHFLKEYRRENGRGEIEFSPLAIRKLSAMPWPGNVRQLRSEVTRLAECARGAVIHEEDLMDGLSPLRAEVPQLAKSGRPASLKLAIEELERDMIADALRRTRKNQQQAARMLGLSRQGLINKLKRYAIAGEM